MIVVVNMRNVKDVEPWSYRVDRNSPVGNPFSVDRNHDRDEACDAYAKWLDDRVAVKDKTVCGYLNHLWSVWKRHGQLELRCWCAPKRCHAHYIKEVLEAKEAWRQWHTL